MKVKYVGQFDEVEIAVTGQVCKQGETVDVPDEVAGQPPSTKHEKGDDGKTVEVEDPGEGLLAQPANWEPAATKAKAKSAESADKE
jgi:hypothetical protein